MSDMSAWWIHHLLRISFIFSSCPATSFIYLRPGWVDIIIMNFYSLQMSRHQQHKSYLRDIKRVLILAASKRTDSEFLQEIIGNNYDTSSKFNLIHTVRDSGLIFACAVAQLPRVLKHINSQHFFPFSLLCTLFKMLALLFPSHFPCHLLIQCWPKVSTDLHLIKKNDSY